MLRYKPEDECLVDKEPSAEDQERVRASTISSALTTPMPSQRLTQCAALVDTADLFNLDRELAPYPFDDSLKKWLALTNYISEDTLKRCAMGSAGEIGENLWLASAP